MTDTDAGSQPEDVAGGCAQPATAEPNMTGNQQSMARIRTSTFLLALAAVVAQRPAAQEQPANQALPGLAAVATVGGPIHRARLLPQDAWLALSVGPLSGSVGGVTALDALQETGLWRIVESLPIPPGVRGRGLAALVEGLAHVGLTLEELRLAGTSGWSLALSGPVAADKPPSWVLIGDVGLTLQDSLRPLFDGLPAKTSASAVKVETEAWDELVVYRVAAGPNSFAWALRDGLLVVSNDDAQLRRTVDQVLVGTDITSNEPVGLEKHFGYKQLAQDSVEALRQGQPLVSVWLDPQPLLSALRSALPTSQQGVARRIIDTLQLGSVESLGYSMRASNGFLHDRLRLSWKAPRTGLLAAFVPTPDAIDAVASTSFAPPSTVSYFLTHLSLKEVWESALLLASVVDSGIADGIRANVRRAEERYGFAVDQDVLENVGRQFVSLQVPTEDGRLAQVLVVSLESGPRLDRVAAIVGMEPETRDGLNVYEVPVQLPGDLSSVSIGIGSRHLVVSDSAEVMASVATLLGSELQNETLGPVVATLRPGTISVGWTDLAAVASGSMGGLESLGDLSVPMPRIPVGDLRAAFERSGGLLGELRSTMNADAEGLTFESHSPSGHVLGYAVVAAGAWVGELAALLGLEDNSEELLAAQSEEFHARLTELAGSLYPVLAKPDATLDLSVAQREFERPFGSLSSVARVVVADQYRFKLLAGEEWSPSDPFAIVAWPDESQQGAVYALLPDGSVIYNELIAGTQGIGDFAVDDLFLGGAFGRKLTPAWKPVQTAAEIESPEAIGRRASSDKDRALYAALLKAEDEPTSILPGDVVEALGLEDPRIVVRAAHVAGLAQIKDAVPRLGELVIERPELAVRRQAMKALVRLRDKRSVPASTAALGDDDEAVRALAARNLGRLGAVDARDALLLAVGRRPSDGEEGNDRIDALLALADLGDPSVLGAAALSIDKASGRLGESLAYMFQVLSPKLPREEEATALVDVLGHDSLLLRRYALQRLAKLAVPSTAKALEGRLATEGSELRPLVQVALDATRGDFSNSDSLGVMDRVQLLQTKLSRAWGGLDSTQQTVFLGGGCVLLVALLAGFWMVRRRARARDSEQWAAMVAPSEQVDYVDDEDYEVEGDSYDDGADDEYELGPEGGFDGEEEVYDGEVEDGDYDEYEGDEYDDEYESAGYSDDGGVDESDDRL